MCDKINNSWKYDNFCADCDTWSVSCDVSFDMCMDGKERTFKNYYCINCEEEMSISEDDEDNGDGIGFGGTVFFR